MNITQFSDTQILAIWFSSLAMLYSPMPLEEKVKILENALLSKVLDSIQAVPIPQTGLIPFDNAVLDYAQNLEARMRGIDLSKVSTGSEILDHAFRGRLQKTIDTNFNQPS